MTRRATGKRAPGNRPTPSREIPPLPEAFCRRMEAQLGAQAADYFEAMAQPFLRGLRANPHKRPDAPLETLLGAEAFEPIPWAAEGFYLPADSTAGLHPLHEAGAYYLQEPSAMPPAAVLGVLPGETALDLCAAPGGKSTQLAAAMGGLGTLVCNEPVPARAQVLSRNLERMGVTNALVVCAEPERLAAAWPLLFDAVLVDAPCSGEGMFRRHPEARLEWDEAAPERCAARQRQILNSACVLLRAGGRLCYATCTLNREENEQTVATLLAEHPELEPVDFRLPVGNGRSVSSQDGFLHLYPHTVRGEGHFIALLRKTRTGAGDPARACTLAPPAQRLSVPDQTLAAAYGAFCDDVARVLDDAPAANAPATRHGQPLPRPNAALGETLLFAPPLPPLAGIRVLRAGLALGQGKGKGFAPDHALAMAAPAFALPTVPLSVADALRYQRGETLPAPDSLHGYRAATCAGVATGFVKASDGLLKNHYPKGLRRP